MLGEVGNTLANVNEVVYIFDGRTDDQVVDNELEDPQHAVVDGDDGREEQVQDLQGKKEHLVHHGTVGVVPRISHGDEEGGVLLLLREHDPTLGKHEANQLYVLL